VTLTYPLPTPKLLAVPPKNNTRRFGAVIRSLAEGHFRIGFAGFSYSDHT
jgi:hypothetical protein